MSDICKSTPHATPKLSPRVVCQPLSIKAFADVLVDPDVQFRLFPQGFIVQFLEILQLLPANVPLITRHVTHVTASRDVTTNDIISVAVGYTYQPTEGCVHFVDYYGDDVTDAAYHVRRHIDRSRRHLSVGAQLYQVFLPLAIDAEKLVELTELEKIDNPSKYFVVKVPLIHILSRI